MSEETPVVGDVETPTTTPFLNNKLYDQLKFCALYLFPVVGTLYFGIAGIWGLPHAQDVVGTIVVVDTALAGLLGLSKKSYESADGGFDGHVTVTPDEESGTTGVGLSLDPKSLATGQKTVTLKVKRQ